MKSFFDEGKFSLMDPMTGNLPFDLTELANPEKKL